MARTFTITRTQTLRNSRTMSEDELAEYLATELDGRPIGELTVDEIQDLIYGGWSLGVDELHERIDRHAEIVDSETVVEVVR